MWWFLISGTLGRWGGLGVLMARNGEWREVLLWESCLRGNLFFFSSVSMQGAWLEGLSSPGLVVHFVSAVGVEADGWRL